jgi:hypothetical protein
LQPQEFILEWTKGSLGAVLPSAVVLRGSNFLLEAKCTHCFSVHPLYLQCRLEVVCHDLNVCASQSLGIDIPTPEEMVLEGRVFGEGVSRSDEGLFISSLLEDTEGAGYHQTLNLPTTLILNILQPPEL